MNKKRPARMNPKGINELSKRANSIQEHTRELFPRRPEVERKFLEAATKNRFNAFEFRKDALENVLDWDVLYNSHVKGTFEERVALILLQTLDYASMFGVDLEEMINIIETYRITRSGK